MSVLVEFSLPASTFVFGEAAAADPDLTIDLDPVVPTDGALLPFLWVREGDGDTFETNAHTDPLVSDLELLEEGTNGRLYRANWRSDANTVLEGITDANAAVLGASLSDGQWNFRLRFPDSDAVQSFQQFCVERNVPTNVYRVADGADDRSSGDEFGLTEKQRVALRVAYRNGYFDRPRRTDLEQLGEELGISPQAVSQRLRRAIEQLVENTVSATESSSADKPLR